MSEVSWKHTRAYGTADTRPYDANRGAHWFERTKVAEKEDILRGADKI